MWAFSDVAPGKAVPVDKPFPHSKVNDTKALRELKQTFLTAVYGWIPMVVLVATTSCVGALWLTQQGGRSSDRASSKSR